MKRVRKVRAYFMGITAAKQSTLYCSKKTLTEIHSNEDDNRTF